MPRVTYLAEDTRYFFRRYFDSCWFLSPGLNIWVAFLVILMYLMTTLALAGLAINFWGTTSRLEASGSQIIHREPLNKLWFSPDGTLVGVRQEDWKVSVWTWQRDEAKPVSPTTLDLDALTAPDAGLPRRLSRSREQYQGGTRGSAAVPFGRSPAQESLAQQSRIRPDAEAGSAAQQLLQSSPRTSEPLPVAVSQNASRVAWAWSGKLYVQELVAKQKPPRVIELSSSARVFALVFAGSDRVAYYDGNAQLVFKDIEKDLVVQSHERRGPCLLLSSGSYVLNACAYEDGVLVFQRVGSLAIVPFRYSAKITQGLSVGRDVKLIPLSYLPALSPSGDPAVATPSGTVLMRSAKARVLELDAELKAPGVVQTLAFYAKGRIVVGGGFRGIYLLAEGSDAQRVIPDVAGTTLLAAQPPRLAYATADQLTLATLREVKNINQIGYSIALVWLFLVAGILAQPALRVFAEERERLGEARLRSAMEYRSVPQAEREEPALAPPELPPELVKACVEGECVAYVGAGLSAQVGFPTWLPLVRDLLRWAVEEELIPGRFADSLRAALDQGQADPVADSIVGTLDNLGEKAKLFAYLQGVFLGISPPIPKTHRVLSKIPFSAVLTTNLDGLLERTYAEARVRVWTHKDTEPLSAALTRGEFFLLKLYGTLEQPETVVLAPEQYTDAIAKNLQFSQFMANLFFSRTLLFVGASLEGIEAYLSGISFRGTRPRTHYALVGVVGTAWRAKADVLKRRYGIEVLPYTLEPDHPQVLQFLENLLGAVQEERERSKKVPAQSQAAAAAGASWLKEVELENIGPFEQLKLELDRNWNILLGDNGVGKSTILKAIAVGLCPKEAQPYAARLIRTGQTEASITLKTDQGETYLTRILGKPGGAEVITQSRRPISAENWLALGFPPLRTVTWDRPRPYDEKERGTPLPGDLLPLIRGDSDPRLDTLKQWLIDLDRLLAREKARQASASKGKAGKNRYEQLRDELFQTIAEITPAMKIEFKEITDAKQIIVTTDDGQVPIEAVSQGTSSLIGWVGVLLQRFHEIYGQKDGAEEGPQPRSGASIPPRVRYALVLMDELDAHMHPKWQQLIVRTLKELFPNVQFVASTHSPLVVAGMNRREVHVVRRAGPDEPQAGHVVVEWPKQKLKGLRADQILTGSNLFNMESTLTPDLDAARQRYTALAAKDSLTPDEQRELEGLAESLEVRVPAPHEREVARLAFEKMQETLEKELTNLSPEKRKKVIDEAKVQVQENITGSRRP